MENTMTAAKNRLIHLFFIKTPPGNKRYAFSFLIQRTTIIKYSEYAVNETAKIQAVLCSSLTYH